MGTKSESDKPMIQTKPPIPTATSSSSAQPPTLPPWTELPEDLTTNILQRLGAEERLESAQLVCSTWWRVCKNPAMWRVIHLDNKRCRQVNKFDGFCRCAVDHSRGQLVELKLSYFDGHGLLNYAADRSSQLRSLTLAYFEIKPSALTKVIKKLPLLEELHLITSTDLNPKDCETIGISCPMLRSFTYSNFCNYWEAGVVEDMTWQVVAIEKAMPNLRHLRLSEHHIENKGLEAILNGCPHLESLDLSGCSGLDLQGDLGKRCSEQIKELRLHSKSLDSDKYFGWLFQNFKFDFKIFEDRVGEQ